MRRRQYVIILVVALVIALVAWAVLASGKSTAPEAPSGSGAAVPRERTLPAGRTDYFAGTMHPVPSSGNDPATATQDRRGGTPATRAGSVARRSPTTPGSVTYGQGSPLSA